MSEGDNIEATQDGDARFKAAFENAGVGMARVTPDGRWLEVNQRLCDMVGYSREELLKRTFADITHPDDLPGDLREARRLWSGERDTYLREKRYYHKNGSIVWVKLTISVVRKADGSPDHFISIIEDISAQRRAEDTLAVSEDQFRTMADSAPVMIWISGADRLCTFFNQRWLDFTGRPLDKELGSGWSEGLHADDRARCLEVYHTAFDARKAFDVEYRLRRHDGEYRWLLDQGTPRLTPAGKFLGYIGSCVDITERKQAEAERELLAQEQVARAAAEAANRSKDEFLAMVSHELRSPLNAILGYARILRSARTDKELIEKAVEVIERNAKAQLQIVEDLLDSARIITGKLRIELCPTTLAPLLEAALDTVRSAAAVKGITLVAHIDQAPDDMLADSTRLQQVVWNLLSNGVKFTPEGGRVELRTESDADKIRIIVRDTGKGIDTAFLPFIFDRFRQADPTSARQATGLGLGLSLAKHLVELHGGTITAESEGVGRGSTFTVTLPRRAPEALAQAPAVATHQVTAFPFVLDQIPSLEGLTALVVDDQHEARVVLTHTLVQYGVKVNAVSSGAEALAFLASATDGKRPDVLILDIAMPDEDGYSVLKKIRALERQNGSNGKPIPAIALTAFGRSEDRLRALRAGFHLHVTKPVEPAELAVVIASLTNRRPQERLRRA